MPTYKAPVGDVMFLLSDVFHIDRYNNLPGFADATPDVLEAVLEARERTMVPERHRRDPHLIFVLNHFQGAKRIGLAGPLAREV